MASARERRLFYASVAIVSACGMVYELTLGTLASYVLGSAVREFSIVLGVYLSSMGAGAWASSRVRSRAWLRFLEVELAIAVVGGLSAPLLVVCSSDPRVFTSLLYASVVAVGALVGAELPLLFVALEGDPFKEIIGRGFALDYFGALVASVLFPLALVPWVGLVRAGTLAGVCNAAVALAGTWALPRDRGGRAGWVRAACVASVVLLGLATLSADAIVARAAD